MTKTTWTVSTIEELSEIAGELLNIWKQAGSKDRALVLALLGDLGAGKTTFVQQLAIRLGITETVNSPTFVVMKQYETDDIKFQKLVHIDAYRIEEASEMGPLRFPEILTDSQSLVCIEWAEKISDLLPEDTLRIELESLPQSKHKITYYGS